MLHNNENAHQNEVCPFEWLLTMEQHFEELGKPREKKRQKSIIRNRNILKAEARNNFQSPENTEHFIRLNDVEIRTKNIEVNILIIIYLFVINAHNQKANISN